MLSDENLKALIEAIIYVAPEPVTLNAIVKSLEGEERERVKEKLNELIEEFERPEHGVQIRQVAGGYKFASKPGHHDVLRVGSSPQRNPRLRNIERDAFRRQARQRIGSVIHQRHRSGWPRLGH